MNVYPPHIPNQPAPGFKDPKPSPLLGILGFVITISMPTILLLGLLIAWLTSCHDGQPMDVACVPDVAQWAKFIVNIALTLSFLTVPAGIIVSIIAICINRGMVWGLVSIGLCVTIVMAVLMGIMGA